MPVDISSAHVASLSIVRGRAGRRGNNYIGNHLLAVDGGWWTPGQLNCFKDDGMIRKLLKRFLNRGDPGDKPGLGVIMLRSDQTCNIYANI